jgi:hypothetical protein
MASANGLPQLALIGADGQLATYTMTEPREYPRAAGRFASRQCYAAPHVVTAALDAYTPGDHPPVDWDATIAFRRHLWSYGIGVAEAMDTSERGPHGLRWPQAQKLIQLSLEAAREVGGDIVCGAGSEQLDQTAPAVADIVRAYAEQLEFIQQLGGCAVIRASAQLRRAAPTSQQYLDAYSAILQHVEQPAIVHWLGPRFAPELAGYWGTESPRSALPVVVRLAEQNASRLRGIKFSVLDPDLEADLRKELPDGIDVFTGDDYDYPTLILGDGEHYSHGLLGVLDPIAPVASQALARLDCGDHDGFLRAMTDTVELAKRIFAAPASDYKTDTVFVAYLSGHQPHFRMVSGREGMRSMRHLCRVFELTDRLGLFPDADVAAARMRHVLALSGVE